MAKDKPLIIDDGTPESELILPGKGRGLDMSTRPRGHAYGDVAEPFPNELLIPRSEWRARIEEMEELRARIPDACDAAGLKVKNQASTNYCWINAPTHCVEVLRVLQGQSPVSLSPASAGGPITRYRNVGGWGLEGLKYIVANGLVPSADWPDNAIDRRYATPANAEKAKAYRAQEWWELESRNLDQVVSCLLRGTPVSSGLNWWGHQVTYVAALWLDGTVAILIDNSWGESWGTKGRGILQGNRMLPDDATAPRTVLAS